MHKWWFDELYALAVRAADAAAFAGRGRLRHAGGSTGWPTAPPGSSRAVAALDDWIDRLFVDGLVNLTARGTYAVGLRLRAVQTGNVRQYVMLIAVGTVALFVLVSFYWNLAPAEMSRSDLHMYESQLPSGNTRG